MIELERLEWSNMFSYGENNSIDLNTDKLTQVLGKNGRGKSSIALILEEVLYNKNSKGKKKNSILNRYISKNKRYSATLHFRKNSIRYVAIIERGSIQKITLLKDGEDISEHTATATYKLLESIIGIDHKTFAQIVYKSSSISSEFLTSTDSARKKFLIDLLNLTKYTKIGDYFKAKTTEVNKTLASINGKIQVTQNILDKHNSRDLTLKGLVEVPSLDETLVIKENRLAQQLSDITSINNRIKDNNKKIDTANIYKVPERPSSLDLINTEELSNKKAVLQNEINNNNKQINEWLSIKDTCPTCGSKLRDDKHKFLKQVDELNLLNKSLEADLKEISNKLLEAKQANNNILEYNNSLKEKIRLETLVDPTLGTVVLTANDIEDNLREVRASIKTGKEAINKVVEYNNLVNIHNSQVELIKSQIEESEGELSKLKEEYSKITSEANTLGILVKTFSNSGLVAYKIENLIKSLEDSTNEYLVELSNGRFQLFFELGDSDKLDCKIVDNSHIIDIADLSSGELSNISVAVLLSIRKLMQQLSDTRINLLFLDETIAYLDDESKEKLIEILQNEEHLNTFIVSHGYTHPLLKKINVVKHNNISKIVEEN